MTWTYKDPSKNGYTKFKLTKREHNKILATGQYNYPRTWGNHFDYYLSDKKILQGN